MATYNGEMYIKTQLQSILGQLNEGDEVIISDDGSRDNTINVIRGINDTRIKLLFNKKHGVVNNFENAISNAKGDYIFLSDQDDEWMSNKVEICLEGLKYYDCVVSDCFVCDGKGAIIHDSFIEQNGTQKGKYYNLLIKSGYIGCCMAFRKYILSKVLPFPHDIPMHDLWIGNVAAFNYSIGWIPEKLIKYRRHDNNASSASEGSRSSFLDKISFRWNVTKNLVIR